MSEIRPPCLYMLWPNLREAPSEPAVPSGYRLRTYVEGEEHQVCALLEIDGEEMNDRMWQGYRDILLPNGLFLVEHLGSHQLVATAGAAHNPNGRRHFPFGGELGYLIVVPDHRRRGLGFAVCSAVVRRLLSAGYDSIRVCVQEHRIAAIRAYLKLGFEPYLHSENAEQRWRQVFGSGAFRSRSDELAK